MKKLMILTAALATGVMAYGELRNKFDASEAADLTGWVVPEGEGKATLDTENKVLKIATGSDVLSRKVTDAEAGFKLNEDTDHIYFDVSLDVLGQALDELPGTNQLENAKLALFLLDTTEIEDAKVKATNLYAIAQNPAIDDSKVLVQFSAGADALLKGESRLTVKAYRNVLKDGNNSGFTVYQGGVDGGTAIDPLTIYAIYPIDSDGTVDWTDGYNENTYMSGKLISSLEGKRTSVLVGLTSGVGGQSFKTLDFYGNANISTVEMNDSGFTFIGADQVVTKITLDGVTISVVPDTAGATVYNPSTGIVSGDCTITVTLDEGREILKCDPVPAENSYLKLLEQTGNTYTFKYTFAEGQNVTFAAYAVGVTVEIDGETTKYVTLAEALEEISNASTAHVKLFKAETIGNLMTTGDVTLDLNGQRLTGTDKDDYGAVIFASAVNLKIVDLVGGGAVVARGSNIGSVKCEAGATVVVEAGSFTGKLIDNNIDEPIVENPVPGISITGGTFNTSPLDFVAEGYSASYENGIWTVVKGSGTVLDPTKDPVTVDTEDEANSLEISVTVPEEVAETVAEEEYKGYFKKVVTEQKDVETGAVTGYLVAAVLNEDVVKPDAVAAEIVGKFDDITEAGVAVTTAKPGLFYSVKQGQTLGDMNEGERVMATGTTVTIPATKFEGSGFYKVLVNITDKQQ